MQLKANLSLKETDAENPSSRSGRMKIIVNPNYDQLADLLREGFTNDPAASVIIDRRNGERRKQSREVRVDLRKSDRRKNHRPLIEAIIEI